MDANDYISVLIEEAKLNFCQDSKSVEQDIEDTIPAEKILRKDFKTATGKGSNISEKAKKTSKKSSKVVKQASNFNIEPNIEPLNRQINEMLNYKPIPKEEPKEASPEPETKVELISSNKRNRKISSKLLESSEPAAKKIKKMHMMNTPELNKSQDSPPMKGAKIKMSLNQRRLPPPIKKNKKKIPLMNVAHESPPIKETKLKVTSKKSPPIKKSKVKASSPHEDVKVEALPYKCSNCNVVFSTQSELIKHSEKHSGKEN